MSTAHLSAQPGDSTDLSVRLLEERPQITVDENGGLFFMSTGHPDAYTLVSGNDRGSNRSLNGHMVQQHHSTYSRVYSQRD